MKSGFSWWESRVDSVSTGYTNCENGMIGRRNQLPGPRRLGLQRSPLLPAEMNPGGRGIFLKML